MSPIYEFETRDGRIIEEYMKAHEAPLIGARRKVKGEMCTRIASKLEGCVKPDVRFPSLSLPKGQRQKDGSFKSVYSKTCDEKGRPTFTSMAKVKEAEAISRDVDGKYAVSWD